jgi:NAD(P)H-dependent FMN reductase
MKVLVVEGTVREGRKSIHAAHKTVECFNDNGHDAELFDLEDRDIPMLQTRTYADEGQPPEDVQQFSEKVEDADTVVLVVPEYNHSVPGSLKNLLDHLYPEYEDKPFGYITVSAGGFGGVRAQTHLNEITLALNAFPGPSLAVSRVNDVFNDQGDLVDEDYKDRFDGFVGKLEDFVQKLD